MSQHKRREENRNWGKLNRDNVRIIGSQKCIIKNTYEESVIKGIIIEILKNLIMDTPTSQISLEYQLKETQVKDPKESPSHNRAK